jgi:CMP-N,N'-diacetyllegionaminic acid synthase
MGAGFFVKVVAIIPARGGSKGIPRKNIRSLAGKPLIAWSIEAALAAHSVDRVIVSTDDEEIAAVARQWGAEVPFLRPAEIAGDHSPDIAAFQHALHWLAQHQAYHPGIVVHLRPTCPVRRCGVIDEMVEVLTRDSGWDSVRCVAPVAHTPYKMWTRCDDGHLEPLLQLAGVAEPWNQPRQTLPEVLIQTANVDVVRTSIILDRHSMTGRAIYGFVEPDFYDIDSEEEFCRAECELTRRRLLDGEAPSVQGATPAKHKVFCFDCDGVIATLVPDGNYDQARPVESVITLVNQLYAAGHRIIIFTARGYVTGKDWQATTERQLRQWGVCYHELRFGKPAADYYIDDKMCELGKLPELCRALGIDNGL